MKIFERRAQLMEIGDWQRLPQLLHDAITLVLRVCYKQLYSPEWQEKIEAALRSTGTDQVLDLASGGGGPWFDLAGRVKGASGRPAAVTLSDLYPNRLTRRLVKRERSPHLSYLDEPVDATAVPAALAAQARVRTMFTSFHHLPAPVARKVLEDVFHRRDALVVFEATRNSPMGLAVTALMPLNTLLVTPFIRPLTLAQLFLTYVVPVIPLIMGFDGLVSARRTYSPRELQELVAGLDAPDYKWEVGLVSPRGWGWLPLKFPYLMGTPAGRLPSPFHGDPLSEQRGPE
jgi:hypothetical protein